MRKKLNDDRIKIMGRYYDHVRREWVLLTDIGPVREAQHLDLAAPLPAPAIKVSV